MSTAAPPVPFATLAAGLRVPPLRVTVHAGTSTRLCAAVGASPAPDGRVPPALAGNLNIGAAFGVLPRDVLHVGQRIRCMDVARAGDSLDVRGAVTGVGVRRGRAYAAVGVTVARGDAVVWEAAADFMVPGWSPRGGVAATRGTALSLPPDAEPIGARSHTFALSTMASFSGRGNFHSDREVAAAMGYPAPLAQGMHVAAVGLALLDEIRPGWSKGALLECRFVGETPEGSDVTVDAFSSAAALWLRGQRGDGATVLVARAQVDPAA